MKADNKMLKSELNFVKNFLSKQFSQNEVRNFMILFKDIIKQDYPLRDVCKQIVRSMDHPSRLELVHILFGLSNSDGQIDTSEINLLGTISGYLNINKNDFNSIKAMFIENTESAYKILGLDSKSNNSEIKLAYRKMAAKFHPDKVAHLGEEFTKVAEEKFKAINDAYQKIKKERNL